MPAFCPSPPLARPPGAGQLDADAPATTILLAMTLAEALETTCLHRVAGLTGGCTALVTTRPCHAPHHTISDAGLIGGGQVPLPGEVSRAHHGMRLPAGRRDILEMLRQALEKNVL
jgi:magnesium chelatase family protein